MPGNVFVYKIRIQLGPKCFGGFEKRTLTECSLYRHFKTITTTKMHKTKVQCTDTITLLVHFTFCYISSQSSSKQQRETANVSLSKTKARDAAFFLFLIQNAFHSNFFPRLVRPHIASLIKRFFLAVAVVVSWAHFISKRQEDEDGWFKSDASMAGESTTWCRVGGRMKYISTNINSFNSEGKYELSIADCHVSSWWNKIRLLQHQFL